MRRRFFIVVMALVGLAGIATAQPGMVGYWPLDEGAGDSAVDLIGGRNGTLVNGPQWVTGRFGSALSFDQVDDYVEIPPGFWGSSAGSLSCWVNTSMSHGAPGMVVYGTETDGNGFGGQNELHLNFEDGGDDGRVRFFAEGSTDVNSWSPGPINDGAWHHVAVTWTLAGDIVMYLDGSEVDRDPFGTANDAVMSGYVRFGRPEDAERYYGGLLDDVRLFDRPLTLTEVQSLYNTPPEPATGLVSRALPAAGMFQPGVAVPVTLTATPVGGGQVTVTETLPTGLTASNAVASTGTANASGQTVTWTLNLTAGGADATLTYDATPQTGGCDLGYTIAGTFDAGTQWTGLTVGGDDTLIRMPDDFRNAPIGWADSTDIPSGLTPAGWVDYYACNESYIVWGDGGDIWGTADAFHFLYAWVQGNFEISAQVLHLLPQVNGWEKAGVMVRTNLTPGSPMVDIVLRSNVGGDNEDDIYAQERVDQDGDATRFDEPVVGQAGSQTVNDDDAIVGIRRTGGTTFIDVFYDTLDVANGAADPWYGADRPNIPNDQPIALGLCYTSHAAGTLDRAQYTNVSLTADQVLTATASVDRTISGQYRPGRDTEVILTADAFANGALNVVENVPTSLTISNVVASDGTPNQTGNTLSWDVTLGAGTTQTLTYTVTPPSTACGDTYVFDGTNNMGPITAPIGGDTDLTQASDGWQSAPIPWVDSIDIPGTLLPAGRVDYYACNDSYLVYGDGSDIWGTSDEFHFLYTWVVGDFTILAQVEMLAPSVNGWEKGGCMVRANLTAGSPHVQCIICSSCDDSSPHVVAQERVDQGAGSQRFDGRNDDTWNPDTDSQFPNTGPAIVGLSRLGTSINVLANNLEGIDRSAFWYGADRPNIPPDQPVALGLAYTSHVSGTVDRVRFSNVQVAATYASPPNAPSQLNARGFGADGILLTWRDNANNETGFKIERKEEPAGTFAEIDQVGAQLTQYLDTGLTLGTTYTYRVRATNAAGDSAYSNEASSEPGGEALDARNWLLYR